MTTIHNLPPSIAKAAAVSEPSCCTQLLEKIREIWEAVYVWIFELFSVAPFIPSNNRFKVVSEQVLGHSFSFLNIDSLYVLKIVDKRSHQVVKKVLERFQKPISPDECSCVLTEFWKMALAKIKNPRESLTATRIVTIQHGVIVLQSSDLIQNYRYIDPARLDALLKKQPDNTWIINLELAQAVMEEAVAFPSHHRVKPSSWNGTGMHGVDVHHCFAGKRTITLYDLLWKIERIINIEKSDSVALVFQLIAIDQPTEQDKEGAEPIETLIDEINTSANLVRDKMVAILNQNIFSRNPPYHPSISQTEFERTAQEAFLQALTRELSHTKPLEAPSFNHVTIES